MIRTICKNEEFVEDRIRFTTNADVIYADIVFLHQAIGRGQKHWFDEQTLGSSEVFVLIVGIIIKLPPRFSLITEKKTSNLLKVTNIPACTFIR
ncbi:hypothetical protein PHJA_002083200 [Phtheirospermum japonicum]|uniref:Uncharacterized protein n=1 Tax=Phtheirospermum japonicum TaxID=374723 RepID=A0A830CZ52_9LAMI|nr:hypothetical protein PHJA_002083200 [Phtheirospermum japonicum]